MELGIDLQYLLFLQNLRLATGGIFDEFFNGMSKVAVDILPFLPFLIFLCVDKKWGYRFLIVHRGADLLNGVVKLTVCAYRPWIRSDLIEPAGDSKVAATGYSFPSGHSVSASSLYGSIVENQWNKRRWLGILCVICILLTGFSRNFLGVHTPQDVIVGLTEGIVMILIVRKASQVIGDNEKTYDILTLVGILVVVAVLIYIQVKPYPMDYVDGKLLVDPQKKGHDHPRLGRTLGQPCLPIWYDIHRPHADSLSHHEEREGLSGTECRVTYQNKKNGLLQCNSPFLLLFFTGSVS